MPTTPRLSRRAGLWAIAFSFLVVAAFSTAPSSLYGLFAHREHLSLLTITFAYAVYAVGVVVSLVLVGHVWDWYGRRVVLLPAIAVAAVAAVLFLLWRSLAGLLAARVLTGVALGAAVATATAYIADLDAGPGGAATRRAGIVATVANIGGLACGPLIAGLLASDEAHGLTLSFQVFLAALVLAGLAVVLGPDQRGTGPSGKPPATTPACGSATRWPPTTPGRVDRLAVAEAAMPGVSASPPLFGSTQPTTSCGTSRSTGSPR